MCIADALTIKKEDKKYSSAHNTVSVKVSRFKEVVEIIPGLFLIKSFVHRNPSNKKRPRSRLGLLI